MRLIMALITLLLLALPLAFLTGCGKSDGGQAVAVVDGDKVTLDEFETFFRYPNTKFASAQEEFNAKRDVLDSIIVNRLLIQEAYDRGMEDMADVSRVLTANYDKFLLEALYQTQIADKITVSDAEIKEYYENQKIRVRAAHILLDTQEEASEVLERIKAGEDFEELAYNLSIDPSAKRNRGDLGYFTYGSMVDEFEDAAYAMEIGEISPPVKSPYGFHIIKLIDRGPADYNETYDQAKETIRQQIDTRKRYRLTSEFYLAMKEKYPVTIDESVANYPLHKREELYPPAILSSVPRNDFDEDQLDRDEKALVLGTWDGGKMTLGDYIITARNSYPPNVKPDFDNYDSLASIVFDLNKLDILADEARKLGLQDSDVFKEKTEQIREYTMADILRNDSIAPPIKPAEEELRTYYDEHLEEYSVPPLVHLYEIQMTDELRARQLAKEIKSFNQFKNRAEQLTTRSGYRAKQGDLGFVEEKWFPELYRAAYDARPGSILGPIRFQGKYSVVYKVESTPKRYKDYLEVKDEIARAVESQLRDSTFRAWVEKRRQEVEITVNDEVLWETVDKNLYSSTTTESPANP